MTCENFSAVTNALVGVIERRRQNGDGENSYTVQLLRGDDDFLLKKIVEESAEAALAARVDNRQKLARELADLWFHCLVVMARYNVTLDEVAAVLSQRQNASGLAEKAARR